MLKRTLSALGGLLLLAAAAVPAFAGSIPQVCGPGATVPAGCVPVVSTVGAQAIPDLNAIINNVNLTLAPAGTGTVGSALTINGVANAVNGLALTPSIAGSGTITLGATGPDTNITIILTPQGTATTEFGGKSSTIANSNVATSMTSLGPTGSHTSIQEWFVFQNSAGTLRFIPAY